MCLNIKYLVIILYFATPLIGFASVDSTNNSIKNAPKVFIDCNYYCDLNFIKQNITWVNYVRDRKLADVQVIMRAQATASGGQEYQLQFIGFNDYNNINYTLNYIANPTLTDAEVRNGYLKILETGLMPFMVKSESVFKLLNIKFSDPDKQENSEQIVVSDKWRNWVFDISAGGWTNEQSTTSMFSGWGGIGIRKIVNKW